MTVDRTVLQDALDRAASDHGVVGAQLSLFDGDEQVDVATGVADARRRTAVELDTVFQIGSTTKLFNAVLVHQLVDTGATELGAPVASVLPGVHLAGRAERDITLRDLISMRSGIDNGPYTDHGPGDSAVARYVHALAELPLVAPPRAHFGYSNAGTVVAGHVVERLTGCTWEQALRTRVLEPAGLSESALSPDDLPYHGVAVGHGPDGSVSTPWSHPRSLAPAGSTLCASAGDLVRFARALLNGSLLSAASLDAMQTPQVTCPPILLADAWGAGAFLRTWSGMPVVGHSGTNLSGSSTLLWFPTLGAAIATTVNVPRLGYPLTAQVLADVLPAALGVTPPSPPAPDPSIAVDAGAIVGRYRAFGVEHEVTAEGGSLVLTTRSLLGLTEPIRSRLLAIGDRTFVPDDVSVTGNRGYAVAFVGDDGGIASHLLHGVFLAARVA